MKIIRTSPNDYADKCIIMDIDRDMTNMTEDEFVEFMRDSLCKVQDKYSEIMTQYVKERKECLFDYYRKNYIKANQGKINAYKRESSKQKFIEKLVEDARKRADDFSVNNEIFFDVMRVCFGNCIPNFTVVSADSSDSNLRSLYNYFKDKIALSKGLVFEYEINKGSNGITQYLFRPDLIFKLPDEIMKNLVADWKVQQGAIARFYDSLNYKGD